MAERKRPGEGGGEADGRGEGKRARCKGSSSALLGLELKEDEHLPDSVFLDQGGRRLVTTKVEESPLLARLGKFLPALQKANLELDERMRQDGAKAVSIETVARRQPHIQMDIAVGVTTNPDDGVGAEEPVVVQEMPTEGAFDDFGALHPSGRAGSPENEDGLEIENAVEDSDHQSSQDEGGGKGRDEDETGNEAGEKSDSAGRRRPLIQEM